MTTTFRVLHYEASNVLRGKGVIAWGLLFIAIGEALLRFGGDDSRALLSLVNIVLFVVPLISLVFGAMYLYGAREFNEMLLAQPVKRGELFAGLYLGVAGPLAGCVALGIAVPFLLHGVSEKSHWGLVAWLAGCAILLTMTFVALAFWIALRFEDRARGLGVVLVVWLVLAIMYDAIVLGIVTAFSDWPLERPILALILFNPIDLARVLLLLRLDVAAMMGYTGAVFQKVFGTYLGITLAFSALALWCIVPFWRGVRVFARKDF